MITIKDYMDWYAKKKEEMIASGHYASEPTFLFSKEYAEDSDDWYMFNPHNWNGGDILRRWFVKYWTPDLRLADYDIKYYWVDDQTTIYIFGGNEWFEISWYKSRGRTERIKHNGQDIYIDEYVRLCNYLGITLDE